MRFLFFKIKLDNLTEFEKLIAQRVDLRGCSKKLDCYIKIDLAVADHIMNCEFWQWEAIKQYFTPETVNALSLRIAIENTVGKIYRNLVKIGEKK